MNFSNNSILEKKAFEFFKELRMLNNENADHFLMLGIKKYVDGLLGGLFPNECDALQERLDLIVQRLVTTTITGAQQIAVLRHFAQLDNCVVPEIFYSTFNDDCLLNKNGDLKDSRNYNFYQMYTSIQEGLEDYLVYQFFYSLLKVMKETDDMAYQNLTFSNPLLMKGLQLCINYVGDEIKFQDGDLILEVYDSKTNFTFNEITKEEYEEFVFEALKTIKEVTS